MLNVFLHFLNSFLLCLFFLAGLIPQLLQKSRYYQEVGVGGAQMRKEPLLCH